MKMNRNLNSIDGRILAVRDAIWKNHLMDRRYLHTSDDTQQDDYFPVHIIYTADA